MPSLAKQTYDSRSIHSSKKEYIFTSTESDEELDLKDYPYYTEIIVMNTSYTSKVTLPSVSEVKGMTYNIRIRDASNACTLQDNDDSEDWEGDFTIDATDDYIILQSDGRKWNIIYNGIS